MKKILTIFTLAVFNTLALAAPLFEDHFDGGVMSPEWVSIRPQQWVQDGWLHTQSDGSAGGRDSDAFVRVGETAWTDYTLSLTLDPILTSTWERAFVHFRVSNITMPPNGVWFDGYTLSFIGPEDGIGSELGLFHTNTDGTSSALFYETDIPTTSDPWDVVITATGSHIQVWLDGILTIDVVDSNPHLYGGIGIGAIWEAEARFDDVVVIPEPATLLLLSCGCLLLRKQQ